MRPPAIPVLSNLTGDYADPHQLTTPHYWAQHLRQPVRFADGITAVLDEHAGVGGGCTFVEVGPHPVLIPAIAAVIDHHTGAVVQTGAGTEAGNNGGSSAVVSMLHRDHDDREALAAGLARLWTRGHRLDWSQIYPDARVVSLPGYVFDHHHYWALPTPPIAAADAGSLGLTAADHPLLGALTELPDGRVVASGRIGLTSHEWLRGHRVTDVVVMPGAAVVDLVAAVGRRIGLPMVGELVISASLVLDEHTDVDVQVMVDPVEVTDVGVGRARVSIYSRPAVSAVTGDTGRGTRSGAEWFTHGEAVLTNEQASGLAPVWEGDCISIDAHGGGFDADGFYAGLAQNGLGYSGLFCSLVGSGADPDDPGVVYGRVELPADVVVEGFEIHPALLDSALHVFAAEAGGQDDVTSSAGEPMLPFVFSGVRVWAQHAQNMWVQARKISPDTFSVCGFDDQYQLVVSIETLTVRAAPTTLTALGAVNAGAGGAMLGVEWARHPALTEDITWQGSSTIVADPATPVPAGVTASAHQQVTDLAAATADDNAVDAVVWLLPARPGQLSSLNHEPTHTNMHDSFDGRDGGDGRFGVPAGELAWLHQLSAHVLAGLQTWIATAHTDTMLVVVCTSAVAVDRYDHTPDTTQAGIWGLLSSAASEHPGRIHILDIDTTDASADIFSAVLAEIDARRLIDPRIAIRHGQLWVPRLARSHALPVPASIGWKLTQTQAGRLDAFTMTPLEPAPLEATEVRVTIKAAGLNFHDVVVALSAIGDTGLGGEAAGVVTEVGAEVTGFGVGDAVCGLFPSNAFSSSAVTDYRMLARQPADWSAVAAAGVPVAFLTAYAALVGVAGLSAGQTVLIHAGAGGVGQAAIHLAHHVGARVLATAHPRKHHVLHQLGIPASCCASTRDTGFVDMVNTATDGAGVDVVLDCLAGELVDAGLGVVAEGGWFVEIGKTDIRDPDQLTNTHPLLQYRAYDLGMEPPEQIAAMLAVLAPLWTGKILPTLPVTSYGITDAGAAFRDISQARHTGKIVFTTPITLDPDGAVVITGGTGMIGSTLAAHLVTEHHVKHLVLVSRTGATSSHANQLVDELTGLGAHISVISADVTDPNAVDAIIQQASATRRITAIIHTAAVLADGLITTLTNHDLHTVIDAKTASACHLARHAATCHVDAFVLFSSVAGILGSPGQANYAAANTTLDALAQHLHRHHVPAISLAWGYWEDPTSTLTGGISATDRARITASGLAPINTTTGMALFDTALTSGASLLVPAPVNQRVIDTHAQTGALPAVLSGLTNTRRAATTTTAQTTTLTAQLANLDSAQQRTALTTLVVDTTAAVLAHPDTSTIDARQAFKDLGVDSLSGLELRNRLSQHTGTPLAPTAVFDYPTPTALASHLLQLLDLDSSTDRNGRLLAQQAGAGVGEPVAVVGMACRFPGGVEDAAGLWNLVSGGVDAIGGFPLDRGWDLEGLFDPDPDTPNTTYTQCGGFLGDAGGFDAAFFGISPREAVAMDPQQRILAEVCWQALENAGINPEHLTGSPTGVFIGAWPQPYGDAGSASAEGYAMTGGAGSVASGRIAYLLGLTGPAVTIDTACSSSLVATHLACQSLRSGESTLALAGGVTIMTHPWVFTEFARQRGLAADGRCKSFADAADGTGWGEGAGVLVLETLSTAQANNHPILAVIAGSATNQDGASNGLTAPNGPAQQAVIRQAVANAGIGLAEVDVVEAHGTGTVLGDPIEAGALLATYGASQNREHPLLLGSIKSNIGHTQAAAGVAGIIKTTLALRHRMLPASLGIDTPSSHVDWTSGNVQLLTEFTPWPETGHTPTAGVSSFGISGTNAHVILQAAPPTPALNSAPAPADSGEPNTASEPTFPLGVWVLSARSATALTANAQRLHQHLHTHPDDARVDMAYSLATTRPAHPYRAAIHTTTLNADNSVDVNEKLEAALTALATGNHHLNLATSPGPTPATAPKVVLVFSGQGGQHANMGADLYRTNPVFAATINDCATACDEYHGCWDGRSHRSAITAPVSIPDSLNDNRLGRHPGPAGAVFDRWWGYGAVSCRTKGIWPWTRWLGIPIGEIAAAHIAGVLSLADAARVVVCPQPRS